MDPAFISASLIYRTHLIPQHRFQLPAGRRPLTLHCPAACLPRTGPPLQPSESTTSTRNARKATRAPSSKRRPRVPTHRREDAKQLNFPREIKTSSKDQTDPGASSHSPSNLSRSRRRNVSTGTPHGRTADARSPTDRTVRAKRSSDAADLRKGARPRTNLPAKIHIKAQKSTAIQSDAPSTSPPGLRKSARQTSPRKNVPPPKRRGKHVNRPRQEGPGPQSSRLQENIRRGRGGPAEHVRKALSSRRDALILGSGLPGKLSAALSVRERSENALVLTATRSEARRAAAEISMDARGSTVILAAGGGGDSWGHPAMNANSSLKAVVVVATPRALAAEFCTSAHGRPWLGGVRFLAIVDPDRILDTKCDKELRRVFKSLKIKHQRKNVVIALRQPEGEAERMVDLVLREKPKVETIEWGAAYSPAQLLPKEELGKAIQMRQYKQYCILSDAAGQCNTLTETLLCHKQTAGKHKVIIFFPAARLAQYYAQVFRSYDFEILDIHGKTPPTKKNSFLDTFYNSEKAIVFSSDTLARESLLPPIDMVVQVGLPVSIEQYMRRIGLIDNTARNGCSKLLLLKEESEETMKMIGDILQVETVEGSSTAVWAEKVKQVPREAKARAYQAWITYYRICRRRIGWDRPELVRQANAWAIETLGEIPALDKKTVDMLFLRGVDGLQQAEPARKG